MTTDADLSLLQLLRPAVLADPHTLYRRLREHAPVHWDRFRSTWVVTGYAEAQTVLTHCSAARLPSQQVLEFMGLEVLCPYMQLARKQLLFLDEPDHPRIRALCAAAFSPARIAALQQSTQTIATTLLDSLEGKPEFDLLADFAHPFISAVLADLIGLPRGMQGQLIRWAADLGELLGNFEHDPDRVGTLVRSVLHMRTAMEHEVRAQQTNPRPGAIAAMLQAGSGDSTLSFDEVVANAILLIGGGLEETSNLIANGTLSLLQHPDQYALLRSRPDLAASAVEELLRYESTTQYTGRLAPADIDIGGKSIRAGQSITLVLAAANRDPQRFPNPEQLDLERTDNRHLALSWGSHYCLGASLARMALNVAFTSITQRYPCLQLQQNPQWREMTAMRALQALPVHPCTT